MSFTSAEPLNSFQVLQLRVLKQLCCKYVTIRLKMSSTIRQSKKDQKVHPVEHPIHCGMKYTDLYLI